MVMWLGAWILFSDVSYNVTEGIIVNCVKLFPPHILLKVSNLELFSHHAFAQTPHSVDHLCMDSSGGVHKILTVVHSLMLVPQR